MQIWIVDRLTLWLRKMSALLGPERRRRLIRSEPADSGDCLIYRLKHWPRLRSVSKTAGIYRALSMMSTRPVNRRWILSNSGMPASEVDGLLRRLIAEGAVEVIDSTQFGPHP